MKPINTKLKFWLEFGPVLAFFVAYILLKNKEFTLFGEEYGGFVLATIGFVPLLSICTLALWRLTGKLSAMQVLTLVLVVVFGGLTIWFNDGDFLKMKVTIIYMIFASILAIGLIRGQSYLALVMSDALPMKHEGWMILTRRMALFFVALALLNELVWRNLSEETWVYLKTFGLMALMFGFFIAQTALFTKYSDEKTDEDQ